MQTLQAEAGDTSATGGKGGRCAQFRVNRDPGQPVPASSFRFWLVAGAFADFDAEAFDFLVERGEGDAELLGGFGLVAVAAFELVDDDAALDVFHDVEEGGVGAVLEEA
jgi:hypothetical protein